MSNWLEDNPVKSLITYTFIIVTATWSFYKFTFEENKIENYRTQIETKNSIINQYQARIDYLEKENNKLNNVIKEFEEWNLKSDDPTLFYKRNYYSSITNKIMYSKNIKKTGDKITLSLEKNDSYINEELKLIIIPREILPNDICKLEINYGNDFYKNIEIKIGDNKKITSDLGTVNIYFNKLNYVNSIIGLEVTVK
ncbi:hypothetical protein OBK28_04765 [Empedobacter falsenii]|uniref:Uncharacterized protein n=1 Tax=Empedobacter falsenii TaxID=343874 RepID=A0ABY8VA76_9FLAO|nr:MULTISPECIES: hypothetical protein [Empedobacter]WIH97513.1 hypothetical protein OBA43_00860 [Empedobacter falsenii]